ncbi:FtsK/SpoIIIE domain-containing protein [Succinivibrio sp.]|uniref:FtsK/SpoIIIE domain-containing protein n=1 Tax=Succinivibrio sp. TaxID=2053619 RepID=UPI0025F35DF9|nr:FtsK/SpoIIIE domain-containing protein [Succinivibrio sp.]MBQ9221982.1 DNA translocase FtsK [Succinivibrio sp.]
MSEIKDNARNQDSREKYDEAFELLKSKSRGYFTYSKEVIIKALKVIIFLLEHDVKASLVDIYRYATTADFIFKLEDGTDFDSVKPLITDHEDELPGRIISSGYLGQSKFNIEFQNERCWPVDIGSVVTSCDLLGAPADYPITSTDYEFKIRQILQIFFYTVSVGVPVGVDLTDCPHMLITGGNRIDRLSALNSMLISLLMRLSPDSLRLILAGSDDDFSDYHGLPHLLAPVISDRMSILTALTWLQKEVERRQSLLSIHNEPNIRKFNCMLAAEKHKNEGAISSLKTAHPRDDYSDQEPLPYIVFIIEDFGGSSDEKNGNGKTLSELISNLVQKGAAVGIHLILSTKGVSECFIKTGLMKYFPKKIVFADKYQEKAGLVQDYAGNKAIPQCVEMLIKDDELATVEKCYRTYADRKDVRLVVKCWTDSIGEAEYEEELVSS